MYEDNKEKWKRKRFEELLERKREVDSDIEHLVNYPFSHIQALLRPNKTSSDMDNTTFIDYERGDITLKQCIEQFMYANGISERRRTFEDDEFANWLYSIGYRHEDNTESSIEDKN